MSNIRAYDSYEYLYEEYKVKERSTKSIAEEHSTYPNTIRRCLKKYGFEIRNKSQAQKNYIKKHGSPMQGKTRTDEEKRKISEGLQQYWNSLDPETEKMLKSKMAESAKQQWESLSDYDKKKSIYKMHLASKNRMYSGCKNENTVAEMIRELGYRVDQRNKMYVPGKTFEIDIALVDYNIAIEWDGATHFVPIYGEEHLEKVIAKDEIKDVLLMHMRWYVIRCRDKSTAHSKAFCRRSVEKIMAVIKAMPFDKNPLKVGVTYIWCD